MSPHNPKYIHIWISGDQVGNGVRAMNFEQSSHPSPVGKGGVFLSSKFQKTQKLPPHYGLKLSKNNALEE